MIRTKRDYDTLVFVTDEHIPYVSEGMVRVVEGYLKDVKPKYRVHGGDLIDNPGMSLFDPDPNHKRDTQEEIDLAVQYLHRLHKASPKTETIIIAGNHDVGRLERLKRVNSFGLKNLRNLDYKNLILESSEYQGLPIGKVRFVYEWVLGKDGVMFVHGDPRMDPRIKGGVTGARRTAETHPFKGHVVMGHYHKPQVATSNWGYRKVHRVGCMMDLNHKSYVHHSDYENGLLVIKFRNSRNGGVYHINNITAVNSEAVIDGKIYK